MAELSETKTVRGGQNNSDTIDPLQYLSYSQLQSHNNFRKIVGGKVVEFIKKVSSRTEIIFVKTLVVELS